MSNAPAATTIRKVELLRPFFWLKAGWRELAAHPGPSLTYGILVTLVGWGLVTLAAPHAELFTSVITGFVLFAPLVASGIYELSRQSEAGEPASFINSVKSLRRSMNSIADFGIVLLLVGILWERVAAVMFALSYGGDMSDVQHFVHEIFFSGKYWGVVIAWLLSGAILSSVIFSVTVIGMPMVIGRDADVVTAMITSVRAVFLNLPAMMLWAGLIVTLTVLGMALAMVGLVVIMPLLGHATWCAYKDLVHEAPDPQPGTAS
ncbi:MAG: DUF2189 domain-containing protein [bacterium]|nr:DUF2189 domain-containing protein [bacterium]